MNYSDPSFEFDFNDIKWYDAYKHIRSRNDFDFYIINFPFLLSDIPRSTLYGVAGSTPAVSAAFFRGD